MEDIKIRFEIPDSERRSRALGETAYLTNQELNIIKIT